MHFTNVCIHLAPAVLNLLQPACWQQCQLTMHFTNVCIHLAPALLNLLQPARWLHFTPQPDQTARTMDDDSPDVILEELPPDAIELPPDVSDTEDCPELKAEEECGPGG